MIRELVDRILFIVVMFPSDGEDEPSHDDEPENWSTGEYPEDYYDKCYSDWSGIFKDLKNKKLCKEWD